MKKLLAAAAAITLLIGVPTAAEACRRWSEPRTPIPTAASDTGPSSDGLGIGGVLTCSTATVTATYPGRARHADRDPQRCGRRDDHG